MDLIRPQRPAPAGPTSCAVNLGPPGHPRPTATKFGKTESRRHWPPPTATQPLRPFYQLSGSTPPNGRRGTLPHNLHVFLDEPPASPNSWPPHKAEPRPARRPPRPRPPRRHRRPVHGRTRDRNAESRGPHAPLLRRCPPPLRKATPRGPSPTRPSTPRQATLSAPRSRAPDRHDHNRPGHRQAPRGPAKFLFRRLGPPFNGRKAAARRTNPPPPEPSSTAPMIAPAAARKTEHLETTWAYAFRRQPNPPPRPPRKSRRRKQVPTPGPETG